MTKQSENTLANWEGFNKYVGIQGIMGLILLIGFVYAALAGITLPELYANIMTLVFGYFFAKNGVGIISAVTKLIETKKA